MRTLLRSRKTQAPAGPVPVPAQAPELKDAELAAVYYGQRMGGDFYDFIRVSPSRVVFAFMDAAGKVEQNRAVLASAQETLRNLSTELLASDDANESDALTEVCHAVNLTILNMAHGIRPCPAFVGCYNENLGIVCYVNAGHTPGLVRDTTGVVEIGATGLPLGLFSHATLDAKMVALEPSAALMLVSRGLVEGKARHEEFGLDRAKGILQNSTADTAKELCVAIMDGIKQFMKTPPTHNDVTTLALVRAMNTGLEQG